MRLIFVNLPVADLEVATTFYTGLGFGLNPEFSSAECSCIVVSDGIFVMLLTRDRFADFTAGPVGDPHAGTTVINCLSAASRPRSTTWSPGPSPTAASRGWTRSPTGRCTGTASPIPTATSGRSCSWR